MLNTIIEWVWKGYRREGWHRSSPGCERLRDVNVSGTPSICQRRWGEQGQALSPSTKPQAESNPNLHWSVCWQGSLPVTVSALPLLQAQPSAYLGSSQPAARLRHRRGGKLWDYHRQHHQNTTILSIYQNLEVRRPFNSVSAAQITTTDTALRLQTRPKTLDTLRSTRKSNNQSHR